MLAISIYPSIYLWPYKPIDFIKVINVNTFTLIESSHINKPRSNKKRYKYE